jgi:hypothetical protein
LLGFFLILSGLALLAGVFLYLRRLLRSSVADDEETSWFGVGEWLQLGRFFGSGPPRLTYRGEDPPKGS